jgi:hypothetical protein
MKDCEINYKSHVSTCCSICSGSMPADYIFYPDLTVVSTHIDSNGDTTLIPGLSDDLDRLLRTFRYKACQNPRDKVYGILGLVNRAVYNDLTVSYSLDVRNVYLSVMKAMLYHTSRLGDLRCLTGLGFNSDRHGLPSWVRDFEICPDIGSLHYEMVRYGLYDLYHAAGSSIAKTIILDNHSMLVQGHVIDRIERVGDTVTSRDWSHIYDILQNWFRIAEIDLLRDLHDNSLLIPKQNAFWRTLLGNIVYNGKEGAQRIRRKEFRNFKIWVLTMQNAMKTGISPPTDRFYQSLVIATFSRAMFHTTQGNVGLCFPNCQLGDEIWILQGGRVPFLLRPCGKNHQSSTENSNEYIFLGEGYMHNFMYGKGMQGSRSHIVLR